MKIRKIKYALFTSIISVMLCCAMLVGTTFAWFSDEVTSTGNIVKSGVLDVGMYYGDTAASASTDASQGAIFDYKFWEPGYIQTKYVKLVNEGDLAFRYQLNIIPNVVIADGDIDLADVIDVYCAIVSDPTNFSVDRSLNNLTKLGTLASLMANPDGADSGILLPADGTGSDTVVVPAGEEYYVGEVTVCLALKMQETAGNEYQNRSVGDGFKVQLLARQMTYEKDSFDNTYDKESVFRKFRYNEFVLLDGSGASIVLNADGSVSMMANSAVMDTLPASNVSVKDDLLIISDAGALSGEYRVGNDGYVVRTSDGQVVAKATEEWKTPAAAPLYLIITDGTVYASADGNTLDERVLSYSELLGGLNNFYNNNIYDVDEIYEACGYLFDTNIGLVPTLNNVFDMMTAMSLIEDGWWYNPGFYNYWGGTAHNSKEDNALVINAKWDSGVEYREETRFYSVVDDTFVELSLTDYLPNGIFTVTTAHQYYYKGTPVSDDNIFIEGDYPFYFETGMTYRQWINSSYSSNTWMGDNGYKPFYLRIYKEYLDSPCKTVGATTSIEGLRINDITHGLGNYDEDIVYCDGDVTNIKLTIDTTSLLSENDNYEYAGLWYGYGEGVFADTVKSYDVYDYYIENNMFNDSSLHKFFPAYKEKTSIAKTNISNCLIYDGRLKLDTSALGFTPVDTVYVLRDGEYIIYYSSYPQDILKSREAHLAGKEVGIICYDSNGNCYEGWKVLFN